MADTPDLKRPRGKSEPLPPEPLPGMLAALQFNQAACLKALREGEGRGLTTRQMAVNLERESGYRDLCEVVEALLDHGLDEDALAYMIDGKVVARARVVLAKARGEKPDAKVG